jgi:regulator of CtrA degradation
MADGDYSAERRDGAVSLARRFAASPQFDVLFDEGMILIEETAAFLDGEGRLAAKELAPQASALYGAESMRLTTRLMQLASWLLLQRSVTDGEMSRDDAIQEKKSIRLNRLPTEPHGAAWAELPETFHRFIERGNALQRRVERLDSELYGTPIPRRSDEPNPVNAQLSLLETAFDPRFSR